MPSTALRTLIAIVLIALLITGIAAALAAKQPAPRSSGQSFHSEWMAQQIGRDTSASNLRVS